LRHFEQQLELLRQRLLEMGALVESAIFRSVSMLIDRDPAQAERVRHDEDRINRLEIEIDELATSLLALDQPVAIDLRLITAAIKINTDLERMGDLAVNITGWALDSLGRAFMKSPVDIPQMAQRAQSMVHSALDAFVHRDAELARAVLTADDAVDGMRDAIYSTLIEVMEKDSAAVRPAVALMFVAHNLERIADHATNLAEDVLFLLEGVDVRHHSEVRG
jgi:phosphate transport system protein